jgi:3-methyladenine DNA glycosylase AlkD
MGVRMGQVFELAREFADMEPPEIEGLLGERFHEPRAGAVRIMATQARGKRTTEARRQELYELYLRRHDRIDNWDLVDLGAWDVVGSWLVDRPRDVLYELARSPNLWERRTAILATIAFIRRGEVDDTLRIAEILLGDDQDLIHKATGWALRAAGDTDRERVRGFLDGHAATMPRTALRYALEHFDAQERARYMGMRKVATP